MTSRPKGGRALATGFRNGHCLSVCWSPELVASRLFSPCRTRGTTGLTMKDAHFPSSGTIPCGGPHVGQVVQAGRSRIVRRWDISKHLPLMSCFICSSIYYLLNIFVSCPLYTNMEFKLTTLRSRSPNQASQAPHCHVSKLFTSLPISATNWNIESLTGSFSNLRILERSHCIPILDWHLPLNSILNK